MKMASMSYSGYGIVKTPTALEQLLEEISYQRARELRQCLKEESGFVMLHASTFWTDLFVRHFLFQADDGESRDDLLFFVRKTPQKCGARYIPKFDTEVEVYRRDSKKLPISDPEVDWEETVYLNLILQQFEYTLTLAICTRTSPKDLQILKRHSQKVYASPSRRQMAHKGETEDFTYPNIFFMVDNFDEVFSDIMVRDGEMVCVELVAADRDGSIQGVIFQGSIRYEALKRVYDARTSLSTKMAQRMSLGWFQGQQRMEFVRMKGPQGKGHAEMAVTKPKGSGVETPTSEPGFSLTDEFDWDDDDMEDYPYMQRRMSDPSSNLNSFVRGFRPPKAEPSPKSRSEAEGLDSYANGYNEIEAGDLRDALGQSKKARLKSHVRVVTYTNRPLRATLSCPSLLHAEASQFQTIARSQSIDFKQLRKGLRWRRPRTELDDTTYNRLWMMRGFSQAYHFWKESRRASSVALHAYLTYVTLSWHHIITDLLENRQPPILTF